MVLGLESSALFVNTIDKDMVKYAATTIAIFMD